MQSHQLFLSKKDGYASMIFLFWGKIVRKICEIHAEELISIKIAGLQSQLT